MTVTGSRFSLRRYSGCNLHVYAPLPSYSRQFSKEIRERTFLEKLARTRLYVTEDSLGGRQPDGRDAHGPWVYMHTGDCLWDWLANRVFVRVGPIAEPFYRLHEHVHTSHDHPKRAYVFQPLKRATVIALEYLDSVLDSIPTAEFSRDANVQVIRLYPRGDWGCMMGVANLSSRLDEYWETDVWKEAYDWRIEVTLPALTPEQEDLLREESGGRDFLVQLTTRYQALGERAPASRVSWTATASASTYAQRAAQAALSRCRFPFGSSWATPKKIT